MSLAPPPSSNNPINNFINSVSSNFNNLVNNVNNTLVFLNNTFNSLIIGGFDFVENEFHPLADDEVNGGSKFLPFAARAQIPFIVSDGIKIALGVYVLSLAMDFIPTLRGSTLLNLAVFVQELYAVNKAVDAFTGNLVGTALSEPLRRYYNLIFRPTPLDVQTAIDCFYKLEITQVDLFIILTQEGYNDKDALHIINASRETPAPNLLIRLAKIKSLDPNYIISVLKRNRFTGTDLSNMFDIVQLDSVATRLDQFVSDITVEYSNGYISQEQFLIYLTYGLKQGNEAIAVDNIANIQLQTTYIKLKIKIINSAFEQGFIDQAGLKSMYSALSLPEMTANLFFVDELLKVGINPNELLQFPAMVFFQPSGMTFDLSIHP